jgi:ribosomal protein S18 acetylase RimI-like enzyme
MIHFNNREHGKLIAETANSLFSVVTHKVISRSEDGVLYGGTLYENWTGFGGSIAIHAAGFRPMWVNRDLLWATFDYPFNQLQVTRVFGQVPANNDEAIHFNHSLGFKDLVRIEGVFPDGDMILMQMLREDCRALKVKPKDLVSNMENRNG